MKHSFTRADRLCSVIYAAAIGATAVLDKRAAETRVFSLELRWCDCWLAGDDTLRFVYQVLLDLGSIPHLQTILPISLPLPVFPFRFRAPMPILYLSIRPFSAVLTLVSDILS